MMAVLLAASMVVSSTGVGVLADEITFDDGIVVEDAGFAIEEPVVEDEVFVEEPVAEENGFEAEEPVVDNSDIFEAIASAEGDFANDEGTVGFPEIVANDVEKTYDGTPVALDITIRGGDSSWKVTYMQPDGKYSENPPEIKKVADTKEYTVKATKDITGETVTDTYYATIKPAKLTVTLNDPNFTYGDDLAKAVAEKDFSVSGFISPDTFSSAIEIASGKEWTDLKYEDGDVLPTVSDKASKAGTFRITKDNLVEFAALTATDSNYELSYADSTVTVAKADLTVTWPTTTNLSYTGSDQEFAIFGSPQTGTVNASVKPAKGIDGSTSLSIKLDGNTGKNAGSYTAKIVGVYLGDTQSDDYDVTANYNIKNDTQAWSIGKAKIYAVVDPTTAPKIVYGQESVTKDLKKSDITFYELDKDTGAYKEMFPQPAQSDISGTSIVFGTDFTPYTAATKEVKIWYESGLTSDKYEIASEKTNTYTTTVLPAPVYVTANKVTVNVNDPQPDLSKEYKLEDWNLFDTSTTPATATLIEGTAKTLQRDIDNGSIEVSLATVPVNPSEVKTYPIVITMSNGGSENALANYTIYQEKDDTGAGAVTPVDKKVTIQNDNKYEVIWGDFNVKFEDFKGPHDGQPHTITVTPDPLPKGVEVYYQMTKGGVTTPPTGWGTEKADTGYTTAVATFKASSSKNLPTITDLADSVATVYYFVESTGLGKAEWGKATITLLDDAAAAAAEVEKKIDEATKKDAEGNYDADKVKAAKDAYDALSDKEKKEVSSAAKKKLEDAVAAVKDQVDKKAAKDVEDKIDALPAAADAKASDKAAADAAVEAYGKLTDDQKKLVPADKVKKMNDVKAAADKAAEDADAKAAKAVADAIEALPTPSDVTLADKDKIEAADKALEGLTDAQKELVPIEDKEKLLAAKQALAAAEEAEKKAEEEAKVAKDAIAAIKTADPGKGKEATEAARKAYDGLSMSARAKMTEDEVKELAQAETCYGKDATFTAGEGIYRVLSNGDVTYLKPTHPENTYFQVPNDVKCPEGYSFKVVKVSTQAFKGCSNVKKIWMGKNIVTIGAYAFKGATNLTKLIVRTQDITVPSKVTNAFKAGGKSKGAKLNVQVWEKMISTYEPMFRNEGGLNAKAKITALD